MKSFKKFLTLLVSRSFSPSLKLRRTGSVGLFLFALTVATQVDAAMRFVVPQQQQHLERSQQKLEKLSANYKSCTDEELRNNSSLRIELEIMIWDFLHYSCYFDSERRMLSDFLATFQDRPVALRHVVGEILERTISRFSYYVPDVRHSALEVLEVY